MKRLPALLALAAGLLISGPAAGQEPTSRPPPDGAGATAYLAPSHWSEGALRRLDALGLLPADHVGGHGATTRRELIRLLETAVSRADEATRPVPERYLRLACAELARLCGPTEPGLELHGSSLAVGYAHRSGGVLTALGRPVSPVAAPSPVEDVGTFQAAADLAGGAGPVGARLKATLSSGGGDVAEAYLFGVAGPIGGWVGRRFVGFGYGRESILLSGRVALDGVGVETQPFRLPGVLGHLGRIRISTGLHQLDSVAPIESPYLWSTRASVDPHPRLRIGLNRAAVVSLDSQDAWTKVRRLAEVLVGKHSVTNQLDNQVASVDLRYRPPIQGVPLSLYLEWGLEDSAGAWSDVPGVVTGAYLGAVPGLPALAVGVEHASFAGSCCGNPPWYRHGGFVAGWTDDRVPLGHELGGHGYEWRLWTDATVGASAVTAELFYRKRHAENLYAPLRAGIARGGRVEWIILAGAQLEIGGHVSYEAGAGGWDELDLGLTGGFLFP